jgi:hypothetical protein
MTMSKRTSIEELMWRHQQRYLYMNTKAKAVGFAALVKSMAGFRWGDSLEAHNTSISNELQNALIEGTDYDSADESPI